MGWGVFRSWLSVHVEWNHCLNNLRVRLAPMTTGLMGPLEECRDTVARQDYPVLIGLVPLLLFLVNQDGFQTLLQAFVDVAKLSQVLQLSESI